MGKIAQWIYDGNLSLKYYSKQYKEERGNDTFSFSAMDQVFQRSLEQLYKDDPEQRATLNRIVNRFMSSPFNWPVPNVGDTL
jgi:dephospho-CoA kinase